MALNQDQAYAEGWCVSECSGSSTIPEGWHEIQKLDAANVFESDDAARAHVYTQAAAGSEYHRKLLTFMDNRNYALTK